MEVFANMDSGTATLILQLQLEDSNELFESFEGKGKGREGVLSDSQIAFQMYKEDLERTAVLVADRTMSSSIARACESDGVVVVESLSQEQAAAGDRDVACALGGVAAHCSLSPWTVGSHISVKNAVMNCLHTFSSVDSAISQLVTGAGGTDSNIASSFGLAVEKKCAWTKSIIFLEVGIYDMKRI